MAIINRKVITLKAGRTQKALKRLGKWAGFQYSFSGHLRNRKYTGYKMQMPNGDVVIHLWLLH